MRSRIYILAVLFFAMAMFTTVQVKADGKDNSDNHSDQNDKGKDRDTDKKGNNSDKDLPINTAIVALLVAGTGIGVIAIKKANSAAAKGF